MTTITTYKNFNIPIDDFNHLIDPIRYIESYTEKKQTKVKRVR